ncbi:hypothetical protein GXM_07123 [Nostoc sphaeroides CCNUC1]|uniref:Uncharacterized protein n=1 Tax=Nostoc sphaeroides CCNUC1 TaxID=2653204 RepID=A0A5P8WCI0_9NOSO|nr:hypothetical protein GXM_07123 [Nostoc sphaeroides CCNUC1]
MQRKETGGQLSQFAITNSQFAIINSPLKALALNIEGLVTLK